MSTFYSTKDQIVNAALDTLVLCRGGLVQRFHPDCNSKVVIRSKWDSNSKVAIISGGGSGHEPLHAGFVGEGLLTAAVCGSIFASPSVDAILAAIYSVTGIPGCILIVKNYTGDRINFGLAAEEARAQGYIVEVLFVSDDITTPTCPRGLAGTIFVHKIAGYLSEQGKSLREIKDVLDSAVANIHTIGVARDTCTVPGNAKQERMTDDEVEIGLGIHGEPGVEKYKFASPNTLIQNLAQRLLSHVDASARYAVLFNNLGGLSTLECAGIFKYFLETDIFRNVDYVMGPATMVTALDMPGFSISFIKVHKSYSTALLSDIPFKVWPGFSKVVRTPFIQPPQPPKSEFVPSADPKVREITETIIQTCIEMQHDINTIDAKVGDGDAGNTFAEAANAIRAKLDDLPFAQGADLLAALGRIIREASGGSSGALLAIMFAKASKAFKSDSNWATALLAGIDAMQTYGQAQPGDRTMIDSLRPAVETLQNKPGLRAAAEAARLGADATAQMIARAGRSAYLDSKALEGVNDPGAEAIARIFESLITK